LHWNLIDDSRTFAITGPTECLRRPDAEGATHLAEPIVDAEIDRIFPCQPEAEVAPPAGSNSLESKSLKLSATLPIGPKATKPNLPRKIDCSVGPLFPSTIRAIIRHKFG